MTLSRAQSTVEKGTAGAGSAHKVAKKKQIGKHQTSFSPSPQGPTTRCPTSQWTWKNGGLHAEPHPRRTLDTLPPKLLLPFSLPVPIRKALPTYPSPPTLRDAAQSFSPRQSPQPSHTPRALPEQPSRGLNHSRGNDPTGQGGSSALALKCSSKMLVSFTLSGRGLMSS